jgi:hypothetical protein
VVTQQSVKEYLESTGGKSEGGKMAGCKRGGGPGSVNGKGGDGFCRN